MVFSGPKGEGGPEPDSREVRASPCVMDVLRRSYLHLRLHYHEVHLPFGLVSGAPLYYSHTLALCRANVVEVSPLGGVHCYLLQLPPAV